MRKGGDGVASDPMIQNDQAFQIETEGIGIIAPSKRHGTPKELFFVWFAAVLTFTGVIIGQLFTALGLNVWESLVAAVLCSVSFAILGWASATGPKSGTVTLTTSRAAFGIKGNVVPAFFSWLSAVGWEAVTMVLTVYALLSLSQIMGGPGSGTVPTIIALIVAIALTYIVPLFGHATVVLMQRILAYALAVSGVLLLIGVIPHVNWGFAPSVKSMAADGPFPTFVLALSIGLISTVWGWTNFAADYSRYLPKDTPSKQIVWFTFLGGGIASFIVMSLGILLGTFINAKAYAQNPVFAITHAVPAWAVVPFLVVVILGDVTANYLNSYSSGMSFLSMGIRMKRYLAVIVDAAICTLIALYALFVSPGFVNFFENFLSLNILVIGPWTAIYLVYYWMYKGQYHSADLVDSSPRSAYWYSGGVNWRALIALFVGAFATFWTVNSALWVSPLSTHWFGGADLSAYFGPVFTGLLFFILMRNSSQELSVMQAKAQ
ncbi:allantoin permease [Sulfobacillus thermosulfidooxidans]|nr:allantoin permease [Sulfobacillus thermosulfidooxidans]OLZ16295.1 allantoin permease [Sulfobacillus thermosulfidooxidans]OLZ18490.1 allantoin permease [Sulfobacillus thermosulfidooxidans]